MDTNENYQSPDEELDDPANQEDYPDKDDLDQDDKDIDIDNNDSAEIPDGDDVDLERAE